MTPQKPLEVPKSPEASIVGTETLNQFRHSAVGRFYLNYLKRIPLFRALAIRLWKSLYPLYAVYILSPLNRNPATSWRPLINASEHPRCVAEVVLCAPAHVQMPQIRVMPETASEELAEACISYEFPAVTLATLMGVEIRGGTNLVMAGNAAICHGLYDFARDYTSEELHGRHLIDPDRRRMRVLTVDPSPMHQPVAAAFLDACAPNYAHWLTEVLPRVAAFCSQQSTADVPLVVDDGLHPNILESLRLIAGPAREILVLPRGRAMTVDTLYLTSVAGYVPFERRRAKLGGHSHGKFSPTALGLLRANLLEKSSHPHGAKRGRKIYLRRNSGVRRVTNSDEIESSLVRRGFEVVEPEKLSFLEQVQLFSQANIVVGSSGAALANIVLMPPRSNIVILIGRHPDTSYGYWQSIARASGNQVSYVLGKQIQRRSNIHSDFIIDLNHLLPLVESTP